jgi:hypothetical protein
MTIEIKLGEQYKPGKKIPAGEWHCLIAPSGSRRVQSLAFDNHISEDEKMKYYRLPEIKIVMPKKPKPGEWWEVRVKGTSCKMLRRFNGENYVLSDFNGDTRGEKHEYEFIRRWEPVEE